MSRLSTTYRVNGGPCMNGFVERGCDSYVVYDAAVGGNVVQGAEAVPHGTCPNEVHVVPTGLDCNGQPTPMVHDACVHMQLVTANEWARYTNEVLRQVQQESLITRNLMLDKLNELIAAVQAGGAGGAPVDLTAYTVDCNKEQVVPQ